MLPLTPQQLFLYPLLPFFLSPLTSAQQQQQPANGGGGTGNLIPSSFPSCAQSCPLLTQAAQSCLSNPPAAQSCFCQSALLAQLYNPAPVQVCSECSAGDMLTIQNGYKSQCKAAGAPAAANVQLSPTTSTSGTSSTSATSTGTSTPTNVGKFSDQGSTDAQKGPWISTHWRWILMLVLVAIGLSLVAVAGTIWHRRYHRKREAQWAQSSASLPNINEWGPGQSVHDLGYASSRPGSRQGGGWNEKGKGKDGGAQQQVRGVNEPPPARVREMKY